MPRSNSEEEAETVSTEDGVSISGDLGFVMLFIVH